MIIEKCLILHRNRKRKTSITNMLTTLYRKIIPEKVRDIIYKAFLKRFLEFYRPYKLWLRTIICGKESREEQEALKILWKHGNSAYPYAWRQEYDKATYLVQIDESNGLPYVTHHNKRLYFKRLASENEIAQTETAYQHLLIEQDPRSAHRYVTAYEDLRGKTLLDVGTAEGIFTLDCIEYVKHAYLFECDEKWIESLKATFAPWKDKVTIVRKYVSDTDDERQITLDTFMKDKSTEDLFLKMDIEGCEQKTLKGARHLLENATNLSGAIATYHTHDARQEIKAILEEKHFVTETTPGFLYFDKEMRRGIIRFSKPTASKA